MQKISKLEFQTSSSRKIGSTLRKTELANKEIFGTLSYIPNETYLIDIVCSVAFNDYI